ncbi:MAG: iron chelate uptake ABC transporter family permease subunit [Chloroflexi bacterium]|nr:iron chelate uptake ABC transporter family permease subunit [Chloroflexota bacterium]
MPTIGPLLLLLTTGHALNVLQFGDDQAQQMGLNVERTKRLLLIAASLTTAAAVAFSGIIGFIGLIVPHVVRMIWGPDYRRLTPLSILAARRCWCWSRYFGAGSPAPQLLPVGGWVTSPGRRAVFLMDFVSGENESDVVDLKGLCFIGSNFSQANP